MQSVLQSPLPALAVLAALPLAARFPLQASTGAASSARPASFDDPTLATSCQPRWSGTFTSQFQVSGSPEAFAEFDDGTGRAVYVGGDFVSVGGVGGAPLVGANNVARWDGASWAPLGTGVNQDVYVLEVFDDGSGPALYAGGAFVSAGGSPANHIARWDGASWSALGSGMSGYVEALAVFDDGSGPALHAGGLFTSAGGAAAQNIARWDGASWTPLGSGTSARVLALAVFDDGSGPALYAGGAFPTAGGVTVNSIARWDGTGWSALGSGMDARVDTLTVFDDGTGPALYACGNFTTAGGIAASKIARWDGSSWAPLGSGLANAVEAMTVFDDGSGEGPALFVDACFPVSGGCLSTISKWDGSSWELFENGGGLKVLAGFQGGADGPELYAGGVFSLARWNPSGWTPPDNALGGSIIDSTASVFALTVLDDGSGAGPALHAGGMFITAGSQVASHIAKWDGASWTGVGPGLPYPRDRIGALAFFDDGAGAGPALYAGDSFTSFQGPAVAHVSRREGALWVPLGSGMSGSGQAAHVLALTGFDDGSGPALYAGGGFRTADGIPVNHIARWDGASWSAVGGGMNLTGSVAALAVFDDGNGPALFAAGNFTTAGGMPASRIAKWDGTSWSELGAGLDLPAACLIVFDDGSGAGPALYAGGTFTLAGGNPANRIARWDGSSWTALGSGLSDTVGALAAFDDGSGAGPALYAGGNFTHAGGNSVLRIARWNGSSWAALGSGINSGGVLALEVFDGGDGAGPALYVGGTFSGSPAGDPYLARWTGCPDADPPTISCPDPIRVDDPGPPGEIVNFSVTASDRDPHATIVCDPPSGSFFRRGTTLVHCTATDGSGNRATCAFPVTVQSPRVRVR